MSTLLAAYPGPGKYALSLAYRRGSSKLRDDVVHGLCLPVREAEIPDAPLFLVEGRAGIIAGSGVRVGPAVVGVLPLH